MCVLFTTQFYNKLKLCLLRDSITREWINLGILKRQCKGYMTNDTIAKAAFLFFIKKIFVGV